MNEDTKRNDALLIAAVAGCVIAGAAALALFGGIAAERDAGTERTRAAVAEPLRDRVGTGPVLASTPATVADPIAAVDVDLAGAPAAPEIEGRDRCAPAPGEGWVEAGQAAFRARSFAVAVDCFAEADSETPGRAWVAYMRGLSLWKAGRADEADGVLEAALALDPGCFKCAINLARARNDRGAFEAALEASRAALAIRGDDADARYLEGRSLRNLGRVDEAMVALGEAVRLDPDHGHAENLIGLILLESDVETDAIAHLERARDLLPEVAFVHNNLGMAYERTGRRAGAVVEYRTAVDLDPGRTPAALNLARLDPGGAIEAAVLADRFESAGDDRGDAGDAGVEIAVAVVPPERGEAPDGSAPPGDAP